MLLCVQWNIYDSRVMTQCRRTQAQNDSTGLQSEDTRQSTDNGILEMRVQSHAGDPRATQLISHQSRKRKLWRRAKTSLGVTIKP